LNMSNPFARVFDNIGFKCKIISRIKISAFAGMTPFALVNVDVYIHLEL